MKFTYTATTKTGEHTKATEEATDRFELARRLRTSGLTVISIEEATKTKPDHYGLTRSLFGRVKLEERIFFANNLAAMLSAGLSLSRALEVLIKQTKNPVFLSVLRSLAADVDKGGSLSEGMAKHSNVFDPVFVSMMAAGESSGKLADACKLVGDQLTKSYTLKKKIRGALMYPSIIILAMFIVGIIMLVYIVPTLSATFGSLKVELPLSTRIVIGTSDFAIHYGIFFIPLIFVAAALWRRFRATERGARTVAAFILRLPLIAPIVRNVNAAITARTLSSLVSSGVDILSALDTTARVVQNVYYREALVRAKSVIQKGGSLASVFEEETKLYPPLLGEMISVGEETGALSDMLLRVALFYEAEVDSVTRDLSSVVEPFLMVLIGGVVMVFAVSIIQPIYNVGSAF